MTPTDGNRTRICRSRVSTLPIGPSLTLILKCPYYSMKVVDSIFRHNVVMNFQIICQVVTYKAYTGPFIVNLVNL